MKIRIQGNNIRFRLQDAEVIKLLKAEEVAEQIVFGPDQMLKYCLRKSDTHGQLFASFSSNEICIFISPKLVESWAQSEEIGISYNQDIAENKQLNILIEKDLDCIHSANKKEVDKNHVSNP